MTAESVFLCSLQTANTVKQEGNVKNCIMIIYYDVIQADSQAAVG